MKQSLQKYDIWSLNSFMFLLTDFFALASTVFGISNTLLMETYQKMH